MEREERERDEGYTCAIQCSLFIKDTMGPTPQYRTVLILEILLYRFRHYKMSLL